MRKTHSAKTSRELALLWWTFKSKRPSEGDEGYLSPMEREALLDIAFKRIAHLEHELQIRDEKIVHANVCKDLVEQERRRVLENIHAWLSDAMDDVEEELG